MYMSTRIDIFYNIVLYSYIVGMLMVNSYIMDD